MPRDLAGRRGRGRYGEEIDRPSVKDRLPRKNREEIEEDIELALDERIEELIEWDELTYDDREDGEIYRDYYDGVQWSDEELDTLRDRQQPVLTKNLIAPKINYVLGVETENRVNPRAFPRTQRHVLDAEAVEDALRYVADETYMDYVRSMVAEEMVIEGTGAAEIDVEFYKTPDGEERTRFTLEHVNWDRFYWDPRSRKFDFSDAQYLGIIVWMSRNDAETQYLEGLEEDSEEYTRIMELLDAAYTPLQTGDSTEDAPRRWQDREDRVQFFRTYYKNRGEWYLCEWNHMGFLSEPDLVEFKDEDGRTWCPLIATSAYISRENIRYGLVRNMLSPQEEVNKRASKALHLIHNQRVIAEDGAIHEPDRFQTELARPDGLPTVQPGSLRNKRLEILDNQGLAMAQLQMQDRAEAAINQVGPHAAVSASDSRVMSGRSFIARQQAGSMEIKPVFDHLRMWTLTIYRSFWRLVRQYWTEEKWLRVRDSEVQTGYRFVALNRRISKGQRVQELLAKGEAPPTVIDHVFGPEGTRMLQQLTAQHQQMMQQAGAQHQANLQQFQQAAMAAQQQGQPQPPPPQPPQLPDPLTLILQSEVAQEPFTASDVAQLEVDIVLEEAPDSPILRQEQYELMSNIIGNSHLLANNPKMLQAWVMASELRGENKRQITSALETPPPDPAAQQAQQQMMQIQMQQGQLQVEHLKAGLAKMQVEMAKLQSETAKNQATAQERASQAQVGVPSAAQLDQAQAVLAMEKAKAVPEEAAVNSTKALKTAVDAGVASVTVTEMP